MNKINLKDYVTDKTYVRQLKSVSFGTKAECKEMFIEAFKLSDQTMIKFEMLPEYEQIIEWLSDTKGKGLFMTGSNGRGKSTILMGVLPLIFLAVAKKVLKPVSARELDVSNLKWAIAIDEIGQEEIQNDYGTKRDPVEFTISHCEDKMKMLLITSNLSKEQIVKRYGIRIEDRIKRLCKVVVFKGNSYRK
jgi:DNA replication protein DnaC